MVEKQLWELLSKVNGTKYNRASSAGIVKVLGRLSIELKSRKFIAPINHDRDR